MNPPRLPTRYPKLTIVVWILLAALALPLASSLEKVMVSEEEGFLPPNAESMLAQKAMEENGASGEPDAIIVVTDIPVNLESYRELTRWWSKLDWRGMDRVSWVDVLREMHLTLENRSREALNATVSALEGYARLWETLVNTTEQLRQLEQLVNATQQLLAAADQAYAGLVNATAQASQASEQLRTQLSAAAKACRELPPQLGNLAVTMTLAEVLLETQSQAYEKGYLDPQELGALAQALARQTGLTPNEAAYLLSLVFNATVRAGGPGNFSTPLAFQLAGVIASQNAPDEDTARLILAAAERAGIEGLQRGVDVRSLLVAGGAGEAQAVAEELARRGVVEALRELLSSKSAGGGGAVVSMAFEEIVKRGCNDEAVVEAVGRVLAETFTSRGMPEDLALTLAGQLARGDDVEKRFLAKAALSMVAEKAEGEGAPEVLVGLLNSTDAAEILVSLDPRGEGVLANSPDAARDAAVRLLSGKSGELGIDPHVLALVVEMGAEEAAFLLVEERVPEEARSLVEVLRERGLPKDRRELLSLARDNLLEAMARKGVSEEDALLIVDAATRVFEGRAGFDDEVRRVTWELLERVAPDVIGELEGMLVSPEGKAFLVLVYGGDYEAVTALVGVLQSTLSALWEDASVQATGGIVVQEEVNRAAVEDVKRSDMYSMVLVLIVLAIVLQGLVAVFLPFTGIGLGLSIALGIAYLLANEGVLTVTTLARTVMFSTGLGLGIDYATLVARRFREEHAKASDPRTAAERALRASLRPILAGAFTASVGFGSLALAWDFPFLKSIGTTVPLAIALVTLSSLTFIPALLALAGGSRVLWWPSRPRGAGGEPRVSAGVGKLVASGAPVLLALVALALVPAVMVHLGFEGSHDLTIMLPEGTPALSALKTISREFDPGVVYPVYMVASSLQAAEGIAEEVVGLQCVSEARVDNTTLPSGRVVVNVFLGVDPLGREGVECAREVRELAHVADPDSLVGGAPAISLDLEEMLNERFYKRVLPVSVALMFLSMLVAYGGFAVALAAVLGVVAAAEIAIALTVYYYGEIASLPVPWFLPLTVFTAILGVGMDYNSFSINRLAEAQLRNPGGDPKRAVAEGVSRAVGLVLGLSLIMASAYGGLVLSSIPNLRMMGTALALGVLMAGFFAAVMLTPGLVAVLGRRAWWPWGPKSET